jgi:hypothetical protein
MGLLRFLDEFGTEEACMLHFKGMRDKQGINCSKCGGEKHYWLQNKWMYQCSKCDYRFSLKKGTMMEHSKLKFRTWYAIMMLMTATKKGFSASEIQRQLGKKRYEPIWSAMHKLRVAMGQRDNRYSLEDMIEIDDAFFETETSAKEKQELKRGRGSKKQTQALVAVESTPLEDPVLGEKSSSCRFFKMKVCNSFTAEHTDEIITAIIGENAVVTTDKSTSYVNISKYVEVHVQEKSTKETTKNVLKWAHIAISNAKRAFLGIYHKIKAKYLQAYLDEFVYKLNRRYFGENLFQRLCIALSSSNWQSCG